MKKNWHFRKWFQILLEVIGTICFLIPVGTTSADWSKFSTYIIIFGCMFGFLGIAKLLEKYGR